MTLHTLDERLIAICRRTAVPIARLALFVVFFWFGFLKVVGQSPASGVVERLFNETIAVMPFSTFLVLFGLFECLIGVLFLFKGAERVVIPLLLFHMILTTGPLLLLSQETWSALLVPTLEGQYIIKNIALVALAIGIAAHLEPLRSKTG